LNYPPYTMKICDKIILVEFTFLVSITLLAQVFFIARLYALSGENRKVLVVFGLLSITQMTLGLVFIILARNAPSFLLPTGTMLVCIPDSQSAFVIRAAYSFFSLAHDTLSFLTLIYLSYSTCGPTSSWPTILRTIMKDSALYFLAVLASHLLVVLYIIIVPFGLKYFSSVGINVLTQTMVSRLVLSLRESADRTFDVSEFISENLSFSPNPELPVHSQCQSSYLPTRGRSVSSDPRDTILLSPLPFGLSSDND